MTLAMISWIGLMGIVGIVAAVGYMDARYQQQKKDQEREFMIREALVPEPTMAAVSMALWEIERASLGSEVENG